MATKHFCDRCEKEIHGYSSEYNQFRFNHYIHNTGDNRAYYGPRSYEKDLCEKCIDELVKFLEEPVVK